jgi:hypothetical protein
MRIVESVAKIAGMEAFNSKFDLLGAIQALSPGKPTFNDLRFCCQHLKN